MNKRDLLERQILRDAKDGDTTVLAEILESLTDDYVFGSLSDRNQEALNFQQLKGGEHIQALKNVRGVSNSYNTPERINIPKGTIVNCPNSATRMGDCFTTMVQQPSKDKAPIKECRGHNEGERQEVKYGGIIGLNEGYQTAPYSLGKIDLRIWKIII